MKRKNLDCDKVKLGLMIAINFIVLIIAFDLWTACLVVAFYGVVLIGG